MVTPRVFNGELFLTDFVTALDRLERGAGRRPAYPAEPWHRALCEAECADTRRLIAARYAELDAGQQRVRYCERFYGSSMARMNGRPVRLASVEPEIPENAWAQNDVAAVKFRLRACMRIGELLCELEKATANRIRLANYTIDRVPEIC